MNSARYSKQSNDWWKSAVFYQIYPRSFYDSNNDGIGDLKGVVEKLDHLNDGNGGGLGIDAIWLSPFFPSPQADFGYDVSDYCDVDPIFGSLKDFDSLVSESHKRRIRVVIDLVLNHTSDQHPWFAESRQNRTNDKADWYVWVDPGPDGKPPNNWLAVFGGAAWTYEPQRQQYYLHNFLPEQPDLNWYNPEVREALAEVIRFWMNRGVDGFRLDTANYYAFDRQLRDNPKRQEGSEILEDGQEANPLSAYITKYSKDRPENLEFIKFLRKIFDEKEHITSIGEIGSGEGLNSTLRLGADYVKRKDGLHLAYTFALLSEKMNADYFDQVTEITEEAIEDGWPCWSLSNHDCKRMMTRYKCFTEREGYQQMMLLLMLSLRGTPIIYYGEEVDMQQYEISKSELKDPQGIRLWPNIKGRDGCRLPFPWDSKAPNQGFNEGAEPWLPAENSLTLDQAIETENSTFNVLREMLKIRKASPALRNGNYRRVFNNGECLVFERKTEEQTVLIAANFSTETQIIEFTSGIKIDLTPKSLKGKCTLNNLQLSLPACGYFLGEKDGNLK
ncbi:MAG: alpha-amylase family glycosyl hydrolase [SAR324 cluster bacterium]|nr:alpha-amylase family glycosyl hydrolase [SAR324 cluster bacterium]